MRTPAHTLQAISSRVTSQQCKSVYDNLVAETDLLDAPRDSRVVRNKKYNNGVKLRKNDTNLQANFADEIQAVCSMVVHDDFVQSVTLSHARVPCVVLYKAGLIACADTLSYDTTLHRIRETLLPPELRQYVDGDIEPQLRNNMEVGCAGWTNNACESINHVLKQRTQWRLQHLPELIDKCRALVDAQYNEADRVLLGLGDYHLQPAYARHRQTLSRWQTMSEWQRQHVVSDCFQLQLPTAK